MGSDRSVGKFNSSQSQNISSNHKKADCWPGVKGTGMIPDLHMLCCIIIIILFAGVRMKICTCTLHVENGHVCPSGLSWTVAFRSIVGMLLMITLSCFTWTKNYTIWALSIASLVTDFDLHIYLFECQIAPLCRFAILRPGKGKKINSSVLCAEFRFRQNIFSPSSPFNIYKVKSRKYQGVFEVKSRVKTWQVRGIWSQQLEH